MSRSVISRRPSSKGPYQQGACIREQVKAL